MKQQKECIHYNPEFTPEGMRNRYRFRFVEHVSDGLRARFADEVVGLKHSGWYVNSYQDEKCRGLVVQLPARNGSPVFVPGVSDPWNDDAALINFRARTDDENNAAFWADDMAKCYAEDCREDEAKNSAENDISEAMEQLREARRNHSRLIGQACDCREYVSAAIARTLAEYRATAASAVKTIRERRKDFWSSVPN